MSNSIEAVVNEMTPKEFRFIEKKTGVTFSKMDPSNASIEFLVGVAAVKKHREQGQKLEDAYEEFDNTPLTKLIEYLGIDEESIVEGEVVEEEDGSFSNSAELMHAFSD